MSYSYDLLLIFMFCIRHSFNMERQGAVVSRPAPVLITMSLVVDFMFLFQARLAIAPNWERHVLGHMFQRWTLNAGELKPKPKWFINSSKGKGNRRENVLTGRIQKPDTNTVWSYYSTNSTALSLWNYFYLMNLLALQLGIMLGIINLQFTHFPFERCHSFYIGVD